MGGRLQLLLCVLATAAVCFAGMVCAFAFAAVDTAAAEAVVCG